MPIFADRDRLSPRYVPDRLPHREREIRIVEKFFLDLFPDVGGHYTRIIQLQGPAGVGKSSVALHVGRLLREEAGRYEIDLRHVYLNLRLESTTRFVLYSSIALKIDPDLRIRNMSAEELLAYILRYLKANNIYVAMTVDEVDYYLKCTKSTEVIYDLTRMGEVFFGEPINVLGLVFIARDPRWRDMLDPAEQSSLGRIIVNFKPYTKDQVYDILEYRARGAFAPGAVTSEVLDYVAEVTVDHARSDIRFALDVLCYAGTLAENEGAERVTLEHVRTVLSQLEPSITSEDIMTLNGDEKYVLMAVALELKTSGDAFADLEDVWEMYREVCEQYRVKPVGRRRFNELLHSLYSKGIIDAKGLKVGISSVPVEKLSRFLDYVISRLKEEMQP